MLKHLSISFYFMRLTSNNTGVSAGMYEYLLVVSPVGKVYEKLMEEKHWFSGNYNQPMAEKSRPHITVGNFTGADGLEDLIIRWMQRAVAEQKAFEVLLNNYSGFPGHTIFVRVQHKEPFRELIQRLKPVSCGLKDFGVPAFKFSATPHMTIARSLPPDVYEKAMREYSSKEFTMKFEVQALTLLRRPQGNPYEPYSQAAMLRLQSA